MRDFVQQLAGRVQQDWIDHNQHMNVVRYFALFEEASHKLWRSIAEADGDVPDLTMVASRFYIEHRQELLLGQEWQVYSAIAQSDAKSLVMAHRIVSAGGGRSRICATCEVHTTAFSLAQRKAAILTPAMVAKARQYLIPGYRSRLPGAGAPQGAMPSTWQIIVFMVEGKGNHAGLYIPGRGMADLSLAGARIVESTDRRFPKGIPEAYPIEVPKSEPALAFLERTGALCREIIAQERAQPGWHLTPEAPDYVLKLRSERSHDPKNMNCVEWIAHALELGGVSFPTDVLTPDQLRQWCRAVIAD